MQRDLGALAVGVGPDVLPDRIVVYMWSKAGGTKFNFKFKPRYGITAQTPSSVVYEDLGG